MRDIAASCHCSTRTLQEQFENRQGVIAALQVRANMQMRDAIEALPNDLYTATKEICEWYAVHYVPVINAQQGTRTGPTELAATRRMTAARITRFIASLDELNIPPEDCERVAQLWADMFTRRTVTYQPTGKALDALSSELATDITWLLTQAFGQKKARR